MQTQTNGRGQVGRPQIQAPSTKVGEERVEEIIDERKPEIMALFANDNNPEASFKRARSLSKNAYRRMMQDAAERAASQNKPAPHIDEHSTVAAALWAMQRKLDPGVDVYFVPYAGKVTPILGPQGVIKLAFRSGFVLSIDARAVFRGEEFSYELGSERFVKHRKANKRPTNSSNAWDLLDYAYAIVHLKGGGPPLIEVIDKADITYYRSLSPTGNYSSSGWGKFPWEFARKSVLKQGLKTVPLESEISEILTADESERGIEIPDEFLQAAGVKLPLAQPAAAQAERPSDRGNAAPTKPKASVSASASMDPHAGDPAALFMPGKRGEAPKIADAQDDALIASERRGRESFDSGAWDADDKIRYRDGNIKQLATIRREMRTRSLAVPPHPFFDGAAREPDPSQGELSADEEQEMLNASSDTNGYAA